MLQIDVGMFYKDSPQGYVRKRIGKDDPVDFFFLH